MVTVSGIFYLFPIPPPSCGLDRHGGTSRRAAADPVHRQRGDPVASRSRVHVCAAKRDVALANKAMCLSSCLASAPAPAPPPPPLFSALSFHCLFCYWLRVCFTLIAHIVKWQTSLTHTHRDTPPLTHSPTHPLNPFMRIPGVYAISVA